MYDSSVEKFEGPVQKFLKEQDIAKATEEEERKQVIQYNLVLLLLLLFFFIYIQAELKRGKLMKAMAQRRLQVPY